MIVLLNDIYFEVLRVLAVTCAMGLGIFAGKKIRDAKKNKTK